MGYSERKQLYKTFEEKRQRPLITYVTSIRDNMTAQMSRDTIPLIIEQINKVPQDKKEIDFLIISNGGDPITALRIINILRERFDKISVIVPYVAYSAATILALGADEILMHPYSNLGPVDPQMSILRPNVFGQREQVQFSSEDIRNYVEFIRSDVGITDQAQLITAFNSLATDVGPINIGSSKRNQQLSVSLSTKMLETHLKDKTKASSIAQALNISYYHHGYAVGRKEANEIGLNVKSPEKELEDIMWAIWLDFCDEMKCNQSFDPISEVMNNPNAKKLLSQIPVVVLPANIPTNLRDTITEQLVSQNAQIMQQSPIELALPVAAVESFQMAYLFIHKLNVVYWRDANMALSVNCTGYSGGWEIVPVKGG
jgi:hypothetical protein